MAPEDPSGFRTVAILGLGLIGGSLARDLHAQGVRVLGWDRDAATRAAAAADGIVSLADNLADLDQADVVVLAIPVRRAVERLRELAPLLQRVTLITDVGSTKASIVRAAEALGLGERFVGSHPLAGDHRSGWPASRTGLFGAARVYITPARAASHRAVCMAEELWMRVRPPPAALPVRMDAEAHDTLLGWTSHLPQVVSTALGLALAQSHTPRAELGPGGRDVTRLAGSDPEMWADVLVDNADALSSALAMMGVRLRQLHDAVARRDGDEIRRLFTEARGWHGQVP